jgi:hypothetical protein
MGNRLTQYPDLVGEPLPEQFLPIKQKVADSYKRNSDAVLGADPDLVAQQYGDELKGQLAARREALLKQKAALDSPVDLENTVVKVPNSDPKLTPEVRRRLYNAAKARGLDVGDENPDSFDPFKSYEVVSENTEATNPGRGPGVAAPAPVQDNVFAPGEVIPRGDRPLARAIDRENIAQMQLQKAKDLIADPKAYIRSQGVPALKQGAVKGAVYGGGAGAGIGLLGGGGVSFGGAGLGALGGLVLAASKNPAAKAVLYGGIEKALLVRPDMAAKYGGFLGGKQSDMGTALYALSKDPEFRQEVEAALATVKEAGQ